ncbi:MAG: ATP-binding protein [Candidatus Thermoplasmatota archaeon]|nr:ATP-binding protein [Candidatus Thermoplasmatota archaeon]
MNRKGLEEIVLEQRVQFDIIKEGTIERDILFEIKELVETPFITIISGVRRSGKSTLLKLIKRAFYKDDDVHYFSFEDERLFDFAINDFNILLETFLKINGEKNIFFFDEIQNIRGWEVFIRRMHDRGSKVYITGSNSSMLSREMGTRLTGRFVKIELFPFSFKEYLRFRDLPSEGFERTEIRAKIKGAFDEYLEIGGFPEFVQTREKRFLRDLFDSIVYRDIIARYNIIDERPLKEMIMYIFSNYSNDLNISRLKRDLGLGSLNTVKSYVQFMVNSYLAFITFSYDPSVRKQLHTKKRIYVIDQGLIDTISFRFSQDQGRLLENLVLVELKRRGNEVYYFRDRYECDFLIREGYEVTSAIQVTTSIGQDDKRERMGLLEALKRNELDQGTILTEEQEWEETIEGKLIKVEPIWKWLLH